MAYVPLRWNDPEDLAKELLRTQKLRGRPPDEVKKTEDLLGYITEIRDVFELLLTVGRTGLYGRTSQDRMARHVAAARYRERPSVDD